jgi:voltage-gated potassium channel
MANQTAARDRLDLDRERWELLRRLNALLDEPMTALAFVWLGLLILDFTTGLNRLLEIVSYAIWALFVLDFLIGMVVAPKKLVYLRRNWLTAMALVLPAFRVLRVLRLFRLLQAARAARSLSLIRLVTSLNRGMGALGQMLGRRGVGYVVALTAVVTFTGAAGMAYFESPASLQEAGYTEAIGLAGYGEALWWTAMIMTTLGSEHWPKTAEGRMLAFLLALYAFAIFGYITATIASFFVGRDRAAAQEQAPAAEATTSELRALREEVAALRADIGSLRAHRESVPRAALPTEGARKAGGS